MNYKEMYPLSNFTDIETDFFYSMGYSEDDEGQITLDIDAYKEKVVELFCEEIEQAKKKEGFRGFKVTPYIDTVEIEAIIERDETEKEKEARIKAEELERMAIIAYTESLPLIKLRKIYGI